MLNTYSKSENTNQLKFHSRLIKSTSPSGEKYVYLITVI